MSIIRTSLFAVIERFPHHKAAVRQLFKENESFQTLCEDYRRCAEALRHWNQSASEDAAVRREEYTALLLDLEAEILGNCQVKNKSGRL
jgi:hypothetical protein